MVEASSSPDWCRATTMTLSGFGNFSIRQRPARAPTRAPAGHPIKARNVVTFHASHQISKKSCRRHTRRESSSKVLAFPRDIDFLEKALPASPAKAVLHVGGGELCGVKPYVLRYWGRVSPTQADEAPRQPAYQHHEVLLVQHPRTALRAGFTISGARNRLSEASAHAAQQHGRAADDEPGN